MCRWRKGKWNSKDIDVKDGFTSRRGSINFFVRVAIHKEVCYLIRIVPRVRVVDRDDVGVASVAAVGATVLAQGRRHEQRQQPQPNPPHQIWPRIATHLSSVSS